MLRRLIQILDSTPTRPKHRFRGQSLVELAVTTPILFLLIVGAVEIGYLGSNYIVITDALRTATRWGSNQDITLWTQNETYTRSVERTACYGQSTYFDYLPEQGKTTSYAPQNLNYLDDSQSDISGYPTSGDDTTGNAAKWGMFDGIACQVIGSMAPLTFVPTEDDIAVSVLAYTGGNPKYISPTDTNAVDKNTDPTPYLRYPYSNTYCTGSGDDTSNTNYYDNFGTVGARNKSWWGGPNGVNFTTKSAAGATLLQPASGLPDGKIRGFILTGQMKDAPDAPSGTCVGSWFYVGTPSDTSSFNLIYVLRNSANSLDPGVSSLVDKASANGAVLITEIKYVHHFLLNFPPFSYFAPFSLHLWSMFPQFSAVPASDVHGTPCGC